MGCFISCSIFESFSTALEWIACKKFGIPPMLHILDDFLFIGPPSSSICDSSLKQFISMCDVLGIPIKSEKNRRSCYYYSFSGYRIEYLLHGSQVA